MKDRKMLLQEWAQRLAEAASQGHLDGKPIAIQRIETISGPRAGALEMFAGLDAGRLLRALSADGCALARQFIPYDFTGEPAVYMAGRAVRVEAGWPNDLADTVIPLRALPPHPAGQGRWVVGRDELGATVIAGVSDRSPHWLIAGATGSGKSVALRLTALQLSKDPSVRMILVDGKWGEGLGMCARLPGLVGPLATDIPDARRALMYAVRQMQRRYRSGGYDTRLVVIVDEFQELVNDTLAVEALRRLMAQGRAAGVHCLLATHHPSLKAFGDDPSIRRNLVGRIALRVGDLDASRVAVGDSTPRADRLLGAGDAYTIVPGVIRRVQVAYVDHRDFDDAPRCDPELPEWPEADAEDLGQEVPVRWQYTGAELGCALWSAVLGEGRPALVRRMEEHELGRPGSEKAERLLRLGREQAAWLREHTDLLSIPAEGAPTEEHLRAGRPYRKRRNGRAYYPGHPAA